MGWKVIKMEKTYAICNIEDLELIDFSQVSQTTDTTVRQSLNNQEFVLSYQVEPTFINNGQVVPNSILNHSDAKDLMKSPAWYEPETDE